MLDFFKLGRIRLACIFLGLFFSGCTFKNYGDEQFQLRRAAPGKDVMWIPTKVEMADAMLRAAKVTPSDIVYDLGSGDGVIPIHAAKNFGVRAVGIEYNPDLVGLAGRKAKQDGVEHLVTFRTGDIFIEDFTEATVLTLYLGETLNFKLMPKILSMPAGTRVISNTFRMEAWVPDQEIRLPSGEVAYLWFVPARIEGKWSLKGVPDSGAVTLTIRQKKQFFDGAIELAGRQRLAIDEGRINSNMVTFKILHPPNPVRTFVGQALGTRLVGEFLEAPGTKLIAERSN